MCDLDCIYAAHMTALMLLSLTVLIIPLIGSSDFFSSDNSIFSRPSLLVCLFVSDIDGVDKNLFWWKSLLTRKKIAGKELVSC